MDVTVNLTVNGAQRKVTTDRERPLLDVLREEFGLTGTKYGCGEGHCGACSVLVDGVRVQSCITPVARVANQPILTIEGLAPAGSLHPVQEAFLAEGGSQCGYCTPGMVLTTVALLAKKPRPSDAEIVLALNGNLCRCCNYIKILKAVNRAARKMAEEKKP
jgi:aerobic-type carbon monoxide dehydrogenase small subunit (CoxS/CutS family)